LLQQAVEQNETFFEVFGGQPGEPSERGRYKMVSRREGSHELALFRFVLLAFALVTIRCPARAD
jgi:hypothetical protein